VSDISQISSDTTATVGTIVILILSLSWHEAAHAWVADRLGDPTARGLGRVTLNPLKHLDPFLSVLLPALLYMAGLPIFGGGKPVPINVMNFRHRARDFMLVALAGPGSNLLLALLFAGLFVVCTWTGILPPLVIQDPFVGQRVFVPSLADEPISISQYWLQWAVLLNLLLAVFNLMPIPPLDGSRIVGWLLPSSLKGRWYALDRAGILLVVLIVFVLPGQKLMINVVEHLFNGFSDVVDQVTRLVPLG
jgi:Zn-dependent protease